MKRIVRLRVLSLIVTIIVCFVAGIIFATTLTAKLNNKPVYIFGYSFHLVVTDSMTPEIPVGSLVIAHKTDISKVKLGDNVVYTAIGGVLKGQKVIHKAVAIESVEGVIEVSTQGVKEGAPVDSYPVTSDNIVGVQVYSNLGIGQVVGFLSQATNWIFIGILLLLIFVIYKTVNKIRKMIYDEKHPKTDDEDE